MIIHLSVALKGKVVRYVCVFLLRNKISKLSEDRHQLEKYKVALVWELIGLSTSSLFCQTVQCIDLSIKYNPSFCIFLFVTFCITVVLNKFINIIRCVYFFPFFFTFKY